MNSEKKRIHAIMSLTVLFLILAVTGSVLIAQWFGRMKRADADIILDLTQKNIEEILLCSQNEAGYIAEHMGQNPDNTAEFQKLADETLRKEGITRIYLVNGTTVTAVVSEEPADTDIGKDLNEFPYVVNVAKLRKETVVEGPVELVEGEKSFLFIEPLLSGEDYLGEVIVAADADFILEKLNLAYLIQQDYEYELWRIDSQDGEKCVVAASNIENDLSEAARKTFYLPTEWNLQIEPSKGWVEPKIWLVSILVGTSPLCFFIWICYLITLKRQQRNRNIQNQTLDVETGLYNKYGFIKDMNCRIKEGLKEYTLIIFVMDEYIPLSRMMNKEQKKEYLEYITGHLSDYTGIPHSYCRLGEGCYAMAALEKLPAAEAENLAKELSLELLWKTKIMDKREYIHARWRMIQCPEEGTEIEQLLEEGLKRFGRDL